MSKLFSSLELSSGKTLHNRFMLAPLTNQQSAEDGILSNDEYIWLTKRAEGGFAGILTCAANVLENGKIWPGQLGVYDDRQLDGLSRLARGIKDQDSLSIVQLFHGGRRAIPSLIPDAKPIAPSSDPETEAKAMTLSVVIHLRDCFIAAANR